MKIIISGNKYKVNDNLKEYTYKKIEKIKKITNSILKINIIFSKEKDNYSAEAIISLPGETINAQAVTDNMNSAVDLLTDRALKQIKKRKEKLRL